MKKYFIMVAAIFLLFIGLPEVKTSAAIADGTHSLNYQVNKPNSSSASMANDYFVKPAKLIVSNGSMKVQLTIKNSAWVTEFNPPGGATVISTNPSADQRVVQFSISSLDTIKVPMKIDIDHLEYHHSYTVDFVFSSNGLPQKQEQAAPSTPPASSSKPSSGTIAGSNSSGSSEKPMSSEKPATSNSGQTNEVSNDDQQADNKGDVVPTKEKEENPETSDELPLLAMSLFVFALVAFFSSRKIKTN